MIPSIFAVALSATTACSPSPEVHPSPAMSVRRLDPDELLKALSSWIRAYRAGRIDMSARRLAKTAHGVRTGLVSVEDARRIGHFRELQLLCEAVARFDDAPAATALLEAAGVGLDPKREIPPGDDPGRIRRIAEQNLDRLENPVAWKLVEAVAQADESSRGGEIAGQAAALRALGRREDELYRPHLERALSFDEPALRLAALDGIESSQLATAMPAMIALLATEQDDRVLAGALATVLTMVETHRETLGQDVLRRTADCAIATLGRGTWRSDIAAIDLLEHVRSAQTVPALIAVLERFAPDARTDPELMSGTLRHRAHEVLTSLTGAVIAAEQPGRWREWWDASRDSFEVVPVDAAFHSKGDEHTSAGEFFGIPVRGSRVVFIIDVSRSMVEPMHGSETNAGAIPGQRDLKITAARKELIDAVAALTQDCLFNLVEFSVESRMWRKELQLAKKSNKAQFNERVASLRANGATNLWSGLRDGLGIQAFTYGDRYSSSVDELFILSDGLPTAGELQDPRRILEFVRETNRYARVKINTIYLQGDERRGGRGGRRGGRRGGGAGNAMTGAEFMRRLAEENGGTFIQL